MSVQVLLAEWTAARQRHLDCFALTACPHLVLPAPLAQSARCGPWLQPFTRASGCRLLRLLEARSLTGLPLLCSSLSGAVCGPWLRCANRGGCARLLDPSWQPGPGGAGRPVTHAGLNAALWDQPTSSSLEPNFVVPVYHSTFL